MRFSIISLFFLGALFAYCNLADAIEPHDEPLALDRAKTNSTSNNKQSKTTKPKTNSITNSKQQSKTAKPKAAGKATSNTGAKVSGKSTSNKIDQQCSTNGKKPTPFTPASDATLLINPEKGFYADYYTNDGSKPISLSLWSNWNTTLSIVIAKYPLKTSGSVNLPALGKDLAQARKTGMKMGLRFRYSDKSNEDAPFETMKKQIDQIAPLLKSYSDVILFLQVGFIGKYGEWCYSKNFGNCETTGFTISDKHVEIAKRSIAAMPNGRQIQLRTVGYRKTFCDKLKKNNQCSQVGIFNDCFLNDPTDTNTFTTPADMKSIGKTAFNGGEFCSNDGVTTFKGNCAQLEKGIRDQGFTYLTSALKPSSLNTAACYNKIANVMGYRFELTSGVFPDQVQSGGTYCATIKLKNTGATNLIYSRPVQVVLRSGQKETKFPLTNVDAKSWTTDAGELSVSLSFKVTGLTAGTYDVLLNLPDANDAGKELSAQKPNYRIVLSNQGVQDGNKRYNKLSSVKVV